MLLMSKMQTGLTESNPAFDPLPYPLLILSMRSLPIGVPFLYRNALVTFPDTLNVARVLVMRTEAYKGCKESNRTNHKGAKSFRTLECQ